MNHNKHTAHSMDWSTVTDDVLITAKGVPEEDIHSKEPSLCKSSDKTKMPFGNVDTAPSWNLVEDQGRLAGKKDLIYHSERVNHPSRLIEHHNTV